MSKCQICILSDAQKFSTDYIKKLNANIPATPGSPNSPATSTVARFSPTETPRLWPRNSTMPPTTAENRNRRNICSGLERAISANANRQTKIAQVIT